MSDYKGAALMLDALPLARQLLGDTGYHADWFRQALAARGHGMHSIKIKPKQADRT